MKKILFRLIAGVVLVVGISGCSRTSEQSPVVTAPPALTVASTTETTPPSPYPPHMGGFVRNVIICIGDGMGLAQTSLGRLAAAGPNGKLTMEQLPYVGIVRTHAEKQLTTDSAAAATALATGFKTKNGTISVSSDGKQRYVTLLEAAKGHGMSVGMVVLSTLSHATPAGFAAHSDSRDSEREIATQLISQGIDVLLGGGKDFFLPQQPKEKNGNADDRDLVSEARWAGYTVVDTREQLMAVKKGPVLGLFAPKYMTDVPMLVSLADMTAKALELLSMNRNGFVLMVEGSDIDWRCHDNNALRVAESVIGFDAAVKQAADFALGEGNTVVVVTGDHETGGLAILGVDEKSGQLDTKFASGSHSAIPVPLYAFGPKAEIFAGVYDNTDVPKKIGDILNLPDFPMAVKSGKPAK